MDYQEYILTITGKSMLDKKPFVLSASKVMSSLEEYKIAISALCRSDIAVFDMTNYEPAVMLLLGIRSVVRRGVTIASAGGDYVIGDTLEFPFNIKEVNVVSHSDKQIDIDDPIHLIGERILEGFNELLKLPNYLDLL